MVGVRLLAALALIAGPWTNEAAELAGWDIERFLTIARADGRAWRDHPVEYPPASVAVFEALDRLSPTGAAGLVTAHRLLVSATLVADLSLAWLLGRRHRRAAAAYLLLGLPLVPMGLLRLDLVAALPAVAAALLVLDARPPNPMRRTGAAVLVAVGALVKLWPALLVPALWSVRRDRTALAAIGAGVTLTAAWLLSVGAGLDPVRQIVDLRGATGWQLESVGGVVTTLAEAAGLLALDPSTGVRLELNAYRVGTLVPWMVTAGRLLAVAAIGALAWRARRTADHEALPALGAVMLGSVAALIVTSPLLSPQFLLWLTPWAALVTTTATGGRHRPPAPVLLTAAATVATGAVLTIFGPPELAHPVAAAVLAVRNAVLIALPVSCWRWLGRTDPPSGA